MHCHGYICHTAVLYGLGEFVTACAITRCLEHAHHLGGRLEQRTEEVVVIDQRIEVYFHHGLVLLCLEHIDYRFEIILRRTFHKYGLGIEIAGRHGLHKVAYATIECLIAIEMMCIATYLLTYAYPFCLSSSPMWAYTISVPNDSCAASLSTTVMRDFSMARRHIKSSAGASEL